MSAKNLFKRLKSRSADRKREKLGKATQTCPRKKGDILIGVYRLDTFEPLQGMNVSVTGPGGGVRSTDKMGIAEYLDQTPGAYRYDVDYAGSKYSDDLYTSESGDFGLAGGAIATETSGVQPSGKLKVELRLETEDGGEGALVDPAHILALFGGGDEAAGVNDALFSRVQAGEHVAEATLRDDAPYMKTSARAKPVTVVEGKTARAVILVQEKTWIEVKVRDMSERKNLARCVVDLDFVKAAPAALVTGRDGLVRHELPKIGDECTLKSVTAPGDEIYEFIEIV